MCTRCDADAVELCVDNGVPDAAVAAHGALPNLQLSHRGLAGLAGRARELGGTFALVKVDGRARASLQVARVDGKQTASAAPVPESAIAP